jgi:hypothetical protein
MMVMVPFVGLAKKINQGADNVKCCPTYVEPIEAFWTVLGGKKVKYQVSADAHDQASDGNELVAVEGAGTVQFGKIHSK